MSLIFITDTKTKNKARREKQKAKRYSAKIESDVIRCPYSDCKLALASFLVHEFIRIVAVVDGSEQEKL